MKTFKIEVLIKNNGKWETLYHENITPTTSIEVNNVYQEHLTSDKKKAKVFYDIKEAQRVSDFFTQEYRTSKVITKR